jgi:dihydrofolate reductase
MRKLAVIEFVTLDGVMQSLGSPDEDRDGGFEYGGWSAPYGDEVLGKAAGEGLATTTAYLFGRKTYQKMAAHWPTEPDTNPIAAHLNATPKYVVTRTLTRLEWAGSRVLGSDVVAAVNDLKHPLVLGAGKRLFRQAPRPIPLRLTGCIPTSTGVLLLSYQPEPR